MQSIITIDTLMGIAAIFDLLGNVDRLSILWMLAKRSVPTSAPTIVDALGIDQSSVSRHLNALWQAGLAYATSTPHLNDRRRSVFASEGFCATEEAKHLLEVAWQYLRIAPPVEVDNVTAASP